MQDILERLDYKIARYEDKVVEKENELKKIKRLSKEELKEYEPHVNGIEGLWL